MLDAIVPATDRFVESIENKEIVESIEAALAAAEAGLKKTKEMIGTKGRAYYAGERAKGTFDPGAMSFCLILKTVLQFIKEYPVVIR